MTKNSQDMLTATKHSPYGKMLSLNSQICHNVIKNVISHFLRSTTFQVLTVNLDIVMQLIKVMSSLVCKCHLGVGHYW